MVFPPEQSPEEYCTFLKTEVEPDDEGADVYFCEPPLERGKQMLTW